MAHAPAGLVGNVRGLAADGVRAVRARLELLGIELQLEKARLERRLLLALAAGWLLSFAVLLGIFGLAATLPAEHRATVLAGLALAFLAAGGGALAWLAYGLPAARPLLATTIAVLERDEQALAPSSP